MSASPFRIWDDNPSPIDLLGFDAVVQPVLQASRTPDIGPLAIGVHSPWGGGKSTVLNLLENALREDAKVLVVRSDPWQYDNHHDVRGDLIAEILDQVAAAFKEDATVKAKLNDLRKRLSWGRIGMALGKGALLMQWNPEELVDAFSPRGRADDRSMAGFKKEFAELVDALPDVDRVVVLVDDLDRCIPAAVMATLEGIKLFLAVPRMVFVIAADQDMVRESIAASLGETNRSAAFALRYLEKIVQLPVALPRLGPLDAEAYIGMLLAAEDDPTPAQALALAEHCGQRRDAGLTPFLGGLDTLDWKPSAPTLALAAQLTDGLSADRLANPRQVKRFLNAYGVRRALATARSVPIPPAALMKLLLLEDLHGTSFQTLAATPRPERGALLTAWEAWAKATGKPTAPTVKKSTPSKPAAPPKLPAGIAEDTRHWAASEPSLADVDLASYIDLAASLLNVRSGAQASDATIRLVGDLLGPNDSVREAAAVTLSELAEPEQRAAMELAILQGRKLEDLDRLFEVVITWADRTPALVDLVLAAAEEHYDRLTPGALVNMSQAQQVDSYRPLAERIAADTGHDDMVQTAATMFLED
ncbi:KAP family P-loop NTPase fold protein [Nocardioides taihuensis]|uniref:P-loop NTPase fold protein n=1 Tax=Nocardioides taihuensis TaxID=1835606 RepID=A0ABW0BPZ0_9ACTN